MHREEKGSVVTDLAERMGRASITLISEYRGLTAGEATDVRQRLRAVRGEMRVAKNTLIRLAIKDTAFAPLDERLGGPVMLILSFADPIELVKTVAAMRHLGDKLQIRGGMLDGKPLTGEDVQALATMPPREVILAQLLSLISAPATRLVRLLNEPGSALVRLVDAARRKTASAQA